MCNIRLLTLVILIISCHLIGCTWDIPMIGDRRYEGDICTLVNGDIGVCKRLRLCSSVLKDMQNGKRTLDSTRTCGYDYLTEIVCCPVNVKQKIAPRPAELACHEIRKKHSYYESTIKPSNSHKILDRITSGSNVSVEPHTGSLYTYRVTQSDFTRRKKQTKSAYIVALGYIYTGKEAGKAVYECWGSLISSQHVLTTARCVYNIKEKVPIMVKLSSVNLSDVERIEIRISDIFIHPQFKSGEYYNDVAILQLVTNVVPNWYTQMPICLETKSIATVRKRPSSRLAVLACGANTFADTRPPEQVLQTPRLSVVNNEGCTKRYSKSTHNLSRGIDNSMICLVDTDIIGHWETCDHKIDAPLLMSNEFGDSLIGIPAFGSYRKIGFPQVYTAVYPFLHWIEEVVWPATDRNENDNFLKQNRSKQNYQH